MELNSKQNELYKLLKAISLVNRRSLTPEELEEDSNKYGKISSLSDQEINEVAKEFKQHEGVSMAHATILEKGDNDNWFEAIRNKKEQFVYWNRYLNYLGSEKEFSDKTLGCMEDDIKRTISHFANPNDHFRKVSKKGLVVGDVQSGKTANYIGLINMAVDVGYRTIVLLAGLTEELRIQTQGRVDEGFIGAKSETYKDGDAESFGVSIDGNHYGVTFTSKDHDFVTSTAASISAKINDYNKPVVSVIKKNKKVIETLNQFMSDNKDRQNSPLLIIDDECDNASINTKDPDAPTSINKKIRELFSLYRIVTYVGYSATPFANIFVDPDANYKVEDNGTGKPSSVTPGTQLPDLFPDDFIVLLEPPSNYLGALSLFKGFNEEKTKGIGSDHIIVIGEEGDHIFPARHTITDQFTELSSSLKDAINVFLLSNAVYSIRGHEKKHRSMLINISRFNGTQSEIAHIVGNYIAELKDIIQAYSFLPIKEFLLKPDLKHLYDLWMSKKYFGKCDTYGSPTNSIYSFDEIRAKLYTEISLFEVAVINGTIPKKERFKYDSRKERGARVIVIGGFSLSRGLTLEGLMTSYYNRNATAFDVLLQMGRWFGYRPDYEDLINIFMTQRSIDAFCAVSESTEDLKEQFRRMAEAKKTPREFGLMVREAPDTLDNTILVTSRNKMKNSEDYVREISLSGTSIDTSKISISLSSNLKNKKETENLFEKLQSNGVSYRESALMKGHFYFENVPVSDITDFLSKIDISYANNSFDTENLIPFIEKTPALRKWDVTVATGDSGSLTEKIANYFFPMPSRSFEYDKGEDHMKIGGDNNRLLDPGIFKIDLTLGQLQEAKESAKRRRQDKIDRGEKVNLSKEEDLIARDLLEIPDRNPLLIIFPLDLNTEPSDEKSKRGLYQEIKDQLQGIPAYGFGIGFPGNFKTLKTIYRINLVKKNALIKGEAEDNEDEDDSDSEEEDNSNE